MQDLLVVVPLVLVGLTMIVMALVLGRRTMLSGRKVDAMIADRHKVFWV
ncbi:hypothetical protein [Rhodopila sp.]